MLDLHAPLLRASAQIEQLPRTAIMQSRSPSGRAFEPLTESTLQARRPGQGRKPLLRTGAALASFKCLVVGTNGLLLRGAGYLRYHASHRNPFPFEPGAGGRVRPIGRVYEIIARELRAHIHGRK